MSLIHRSSLLALVGVLFTALCASAATPLKSVQINYADNSTMLVHIEGDMSTKFEDGNLLMQCSKGNISIPVSKLKGFSFSTLPGSDKEWLALESVKSETISFTISADNLCISNLEPGTKITVTNIAGQTLKSLSARTTEVQLPLDNFTKGIYILTVNNKSLKIALK